MKTNNSHFCHRDIPTIHKAMPNRNSVKRQLKFDKPRYLFTKTHKPKTKTQIFYEKNNRKDIIII